MHTVIREYHGANAETLFATMEERESDVRELISGVPGFVSYTAMRTGDGGMTITVCDDKAGTDESTRRAADWVKENVGASIDPPEVTEGDSFLQF